MNNFELETVLIEKAIESGNIPAAKRMVTKSIPRYVRYSQSLVGFKQTYNDILDIKKSNKQRYIIRTNND